MALQALFFAVLVVAHVDLSSCHFVKGSVSCLDCSPRHDLSGVKVAIKCSNGSSIVVSALTNENGHFEADVPSSSSSRCLARLLGGPEQLCAFRRNMFSELVKKPLGSEDYALSSPLSFFTSCARGEMTAEMANNDENTEGNGVTPSPSSPSPDEVPPPYPWGMTPPRRFFRFLPIIGIP